MFLFPIQSRFIHLYNFVVFDYNRKQNGNIAELLLKEGFARCVDWSIALVTGGAEKLRLAERAAKEKRQRLWKDYVPSTPQVKLKRYKRFVDLIV